MIREDEAASEEILLVLLNVVVSTMINLVLLAGIPFLVYVAFHKWRRNRRFGEIASRAGLQLGKTRYLAHAVVFAVVIIAIQVIWPMPLEPMMREGSPQQSFAGLGFGIPAVVMALLYGVLTTGFSEELLFRGLIAGSLSRRLPLVWANIVQALIFLVPHLAILVFASEMWPILPVIFAGALYLGWLRIKSGSIIGPWLVHAAANVTTCLSVAIRSAT